MVGEFGEFVDVTFDAADEARELGEYFVDVGGDFRHGTGQNVEVVVAVHFEFAELGPDGRVTRGDAGEHLRRGIRVPRGAGHAGRADTVEFVFFLKFADFALEAFFREAQSLDELFEFVDAADHASTVDDQFADGVHHAIETRQRDSDLLCGCCGIRGLASFWSGALRGSRGF